SGSKVNRGCSRYSFRPKKINWISRAGFTLLEMMVAVSVIGIALTSVYKLHAQTIRLNQIARFNAIAPLLAQERLALIDSESLEDASDDSGNFEDGFENYEYDIVIEEVSSEFLETSEDLGKDSGLILKKITVVITEGENEQTYRVSTYRMMLE
ncbi:MAG: prepilin-type N-terminal cleavage/methylation domain-containing protein, partial [Desulfobacteraceae bacterium]